VRLASLPKQMIGEIGRFEYIIHKLLLNATQRLEEVKQVGIICYVASPNQFNFKELEKFKFEPIPE
jgi:hypothetical protein